MYSVIFMVVYPADFLVIICYAMPSALYYVVIFKAIKALLFAGLFILPLPLPLPFFRLLGVLEACSCRR